MSLISRTALLVNCHMARQSLCTWQAAAAAGSAMAQLRRSSTSHEHHDKIVMRGMIFHGYHGALPEENTLGQKFLVDATLWADIARSGQTDQLNDTIDYRQAYNTIKQVVEGPPKVLQEAVVEEIANKLLCLDPRVSAVQLYIRKPHVALQGVLDSVGIEIFRNRQ